MISSLVAAEKQVEHILSWLPGKSSDFPLEVRTAAEFCYNAGMSREEHRGRTQL